MLEVRVRFAPTPPSSQRLAAGVIATRKAKVLKRHMDLRSGVFGSHASGTFDIFSHGSQTRCSYEEQVYIIRCYCGCSYGMFAPCSCPDGVMHIVRSKTQRAKVWVIMKQLNKAFVDIITRCGWFCMLFLITSLVCTACVVQSSVSRH
jgi:hypothetical protein